MNALDSYLHLYMAPITINNLLYIKLEKPMRWCIVEKYLDENISLRDYESFFHEKIYFFG